MQSVSVYSFQRCGPSTVSSQLDWPEPLKGFVCEGLGFKSGIVAELGSFSSSAFFIVVSFKLRIRSKKIRFVTNEGLRPALAKEGNKRKKNVRCKGRKICAHNCWHLFVLPGGVGAGIVPRANCQENDTGGFAGVSRSNNGFHCRRFISDYVGDGHGCGEVAPATVEIKPLQGSYRVGLLESYIELVVVTWLNFPLDFDGRTRFGRICGHYESRPARLT